MYESLLLFSRRFRKKSTGLLNAVNIADVKCLSIGAGVAEDIYDLRNSPTYSRKNYTPYKVAIFTLID
jgi:hypothetical protein